jgi:type IV pilus assembly protein PilE
MEVMIVGVLAAVLLAIALPAYQSHLRRGYRIQARAALLQAAQWMERAATASGGYPEALPAVLTRVPGEHYRIALQDDATAQRFTLSATPQGAQAGDACGTYTLTQANERGATGAGTDSARVDACWER